LLDLPDARREALWVSTRGDTSPSGVSAVAVQNRPCPLGTRNRSQSRMAQTNHVLPAGTAPPDFPLHATPDQVVSLSDFRGRPVILAFYPADWSPVCGDQMSLYNEMLDEFGRFDAELIGVSVDGAWCHVAFAHERKLRFPLLADFEPKG